MADIKKEMNSNAVNVLESFKVQGETSIKKSTKRFKGHSTGSIADDNSIIGMIMPRDLTLTIKPSGAEFRKVFDANASETNGYGLIDDEDPGWFQYHDIKVRQVNVRATPEGGNPPPLGAQERKFFENAFKLINDNADETINKNWKN